MQDVGLARVQRADNDSIGGTPMADRQTGSASASLDALRVTIARSSDVENALEVTINPDAVTRLRPVSAAPVAVRVFLVIDGVATVIYDDVTPREG